MQQSFGLEQLRTAFEKYRTDSELQFKYFAEILGAEKAEAAEAGKATIALLQGRLGNGADAKGPDKGGDTGQATGGKSAASGDTGTAET